MSRVSAKELLVAMATPRADGHPERRTLVQQAESFWPVGRACLPAWSHAVIALGRPILSEPWQLGLSICLPCLLRTRVCMMSVCILRCARNVSWLPMAKLDFNLCECSSRFFPQASGASAGPRTLARMATNSPSSSCDSEVNHTETCLKSD